MQAEFGTEVDRLTRTAAATLNGGDRAGMEPLETAVRTAMLGLGASLVEALLGQDRG